MKKELHATIHNRPPIMETSNEHNLNAPPHETTCYTDADIVWDSNFPRGLEVVEHGPWFYQEDKHALNPTMGHVKG
jgi:hypothetical protein